MAAAPPPSSRPPRTTNRSGGRAGLEVELELDLELEAWRIVGPKLDVAEAFQDLGPRLLDALSARVAFLVRLDPERTHADIVAEAVAAGEKRPTSTTIPLEADAGAEVIAWCRGGPLLRVRRRDEHTVVRRLLPRNLHGPYLLAPLSRPSGTAGAVIVAGRAPFTERDEAVLGSVRAPLAVALENDHHLHELVRLREAMEADRQALLARLERQDIADSVVGAETGLREVLARVEQVAPTDTPVLLLGETGSGKEVVARAIHKGSPRAQGPMVRVNCGAIPGELVDSELFGHERGSFTGATATRRGWFERADGGTLFLDEIGELPAAAQVRLLRVVQDGVIERVGGERPIKVDVRIIAATHRDLEAMVARREFREDLWYRISVFPLRLPPLRERLEDVPSLASHFVIRACRRLGVPALALTAEDISLLVSYAWPGNVRELAAVIERATILGDRRRLAIAQALGTGNAPGLVGRTDQPLPASPLPGPAATHDAETVGRIEDHFGAARTLGLNPNTLRARMRKLGIDWRRFRRPSG